jgi:hypothetical protein
VRLILLRQHDFRDLMPTIDTTNVGRRPEARQ